MSDAQGIFDIIADQQGWTDASQIIVLLRYISNQESDDAFEEFLIEQQQDESVERLPEPEPDKPEVEKVRITADDYMDLLGQVAKIAEATGNCELNLNLRDRIKVTGNNRNKPCPCGSGKKAKRCCNNKPITKHLPRSAYIKEPPDKTDASVSQGR